MVAGGRCARPAWPAPEMGRSGAGPWAARCCRGGRPGAMPGRHVEESRPCPSGPRRRRGVRGARGRAGGRSYGGGVCWSAGRTARQPIQLLHERLHHLHQVLRRPGALLLGNHFNFYMNDFTIFIKHYYGRAHCSATTSSSSSSSSTRTTTASPPRRRVAREEALRGGFSRTSTRTRRTSTRTTHTRTTRGLRSARRGPS